MKKEGVRKRSRKRGRERKKEREKKRGRKGVLVRWFKVEVNKVWRVVE